jgi:hypothetical protein
MRMGEWMYRSMSSCPQHWFEANSQFHAFASLPQGKENTVPIGQEVGWTTEPVWKIWRSENFRPCRESNSDLEVVRPVTSRYADYDTSAHWLEPIMTKYIQNFHSISSRSALGSTSLLSYGY